MEHDNDKPLDINLDFADPPALLDNSDPQAIPLIDPSIVSSGVATQAPPLGDPFTDPVNPLAPDNELSSQGTSFDEPAMPFSTDQPQQTHHDSSPNPDFGASFDTAPHLSEAPPELLVEPLLAAPPESPEIAAASITPELPPQVPPLVTPSNTSQDSIHQNSQTIMKDLKDFSEKLPYEKVQIPASLPFSLLIDGELTPTEKEKLVDLLNREDMGIREVDLQPQFENNRVLIPRVSEYAGVLIVQTLKTANVRMRLGPSDEIFSTESEEETLSRPKPVSTSGSHTGGALHPAESITMTSEGYLPQLTDFEVIDTIVASATLESTMIEAQKSEKYTELLEGLQKELQYKAHRKGAVAIVRLTIQLQPLSLPTLYRLTLTGLAIKPS